MKKVFSKSLLCLLSVMMIFGVFVITPNVNARAITQSDFENTLNSLRSQYPNYSTWNDYFDGGHQCWGFARLIAYKVFGEHADSWSKSTNINDVKAGDVLQYGNTSGNGHTVFVTSVSGNTITFVDCNGNGNYSNGSKVRSCGVKWDNTISKSGLMFNKYSFAYRLIGPDFHPNNFPGDVDYSYAVPVWLKADHYCATYSGSGNQEDDHHIDAGDDCYIETVYANGFCWVEYPAGNERRWAYALASDFDIPKKANKPSATYVSVSAGTDFSPTSFWWNASENVDHYDLKIWNGTYWDGDAYKIEWEIRDTSCSLQLPAGYYEAYVDSVNSEGCTMSENVVRFTVNDGKVDVGTDFYAYIINTAVSKFQRKIRGQ